MSLVEGAFNNIAEIHRYSDIIFEGEVGNIDIYNEYSDSFSASARIRITLDSKQTGAVLLTGSTSETVTFTNRNVAESVEFYDSISSACFTDDLSGSANMVLLDEQNSKIENLVYQGQEFCNFEEITNEERLRLLGSTTDWQARMEIGSDADIELRDRVYIDDIEDVYQVIKIITHRDKGLPQFKECILK